MNLTETRAQARRFERCIRELLAEGCPVRAAVRRAYEEYPVMDVLRDEISDQIRREVEAGYGEPLPNGITDRLFTQAWAPDKLTLSARTTGGVLAVQQMVAKTIEERIKKNDTYKNAALAIFEGYGEGGIIPAQDIPKFLREIEQQGRRGGVDMKEVRAMLRPIRRAVEKRTTPGMRAAYSQLLNAIELQNEASLDKAITAAIQERTRYYAERIARTEMHRAYIDGFVARWDNNPDCVAYQWKLSSRHPCFDICDLYAKANLYGMGAGVFPKDKVPLLPAHPHCMCRLKPVIRGMLDNETPVERIEEGGRAYIETLTLPQRRSLLGVHGEKQVAAGLSWTAKARGYSGIKLKGRLNIPDVLKPYEKDGKIDIETFSKRAPNESAEQFEARIWEYIQSPFCTKEFTPRQGLHIKNHPMYREGKSYYENPFSIGVVAEALAERKAELKFTRSGDWSKKAKIYHPEITGHYIDFVGEVSVTHSGMIHFSNKGIHVVPAKGGERK